MTAGIRGSDAPVPPAPDIDPAIVDVDGTLIDSNYQHALSWYRAFRTFDIVIPVWRIHRHIGMGGDQLVGALAGDDVEKRHGDALRKAWTAEFEPMIDEELRTNLDETPLSGAAGGRR